MPLRPAPFYGRVQPLNRPPKAAAAVFGLGLGRQGRAWPNEHSKGGLLQSLELAKRNIPRRSTEQLPTPGLSPLAVSWLVTLSALL